jgi:hypothetical protein
MKLVKVWLDEYPENPCSWDNLGTMVCWHRRYNLGNQHNFRSPEDFLQWVKEIGRENFVILPLYLYDHSGITISTTPFSCPWDSGQVGWIYVTKARLREEFMVKRVTKDIISRAENVLRAEVQTYNQYLRGEVYGFTLYEAEDGCFVELDSCGWFYGSDPRENGMLECVPEEFQELLREVNFLHDGLVIAETGEKMDAGQELRNFLQERCLLSHSALEKYGVLRELCVL